MFGQLFGFGRRHINCSPTRNLDDIYQAAICFSSDHGIYLQDRIVLECYLEWCLFIYLDYGFDILFLTGVWIEAQKNKCYLWRPSFYLL